MKKHKKNTLERKSSANSLWRLSLGARFPNRKQAPWATERNKHLPSPGTPAQSGHWHFKSQLTSITVCQETNFYMYILVTIMICACTTNELCNKLMLTNNGIVSVDFLPMWEFNIWWIANVLFFVLPSSWFSMCWLRTWITNQKTKKYTSGGMSLWPRNRSHITLDFGEQSSFRNWKPQSHVLAWQWNIELSLQMTSRINYNTFYSWWYQIIPLLDWVGSKTVSMQRVKANWWTRECLWDRQTRIIWSGTTRVQRKTAGSGLSSRHHIQNSAAHLLNMATQADNILHTCIDSRANNHAGIAWKHLNANSISCQLVTGIS